MKASSNKYKTTHEYNFELKPEHIENPNPVSITVQNESLSVREIFERFTRGLPNNDIRQGTYGEEDIDGVDLEKLQKADLIEQQEAVETVFANEAEKAKQKRKKDLEKQTPETEPAKPPETEEPGTEEKT